MKKCKTNKGITLIALVVTIIVLLILAGISITMLTGENGILSRAVEAQKATDIANTKEEIQLELMSVAVNNNGAYTLDDVEDAVLAVIGSTATLDLTAGTVETASGNEVDISDIVALAVDSSTSGGVTTYYVADVQGQVLSTEENTEVEDANGNTIVVPAGFFITDDADTVEEGIVIEDSTGEATDGSQFVWIPVGTINKTDGSSEEITLSRYTFDSSGVATSYGRTDVISSYYIEETQSEHTTSGYGNTVAIDIEAFITSAETNGGYYIGRYEARDGDATEARASGASSTNQLVCTADNYVYNRITQLNAASLCQNMYTSSNFTSDLVNSYAWDTATLFLQTCGTNSTYSRQTSLNSSLATTGTNNTSTIDVQCNVYDMASNVYEWVTETHSSSSSPCVPRGGTCFGGFIYTSIRSSYDTTYSGNNIAFRPLLYL